MTVKKMCYHCLQVSHGQKDDQMPWDCPYCGRDINHIPYLNEADPVTKEYVTRVFTAGGKYTDNK